MISAAAADNLSMAFDALQRSVRSADQMAAAQVPGRKMFLLFGRRDMRTPTHAERVAHGEEAALQARLGVGFLQHAERSEALLHAANRAVGDLDTAVSRVRSQPVAGPDAPLMIGNIMHSPVGSGRLTDRLRSVFQQVAAEQLAAVQDPIVVSAVDGVQDALRAVRTGAGLPLEAASVTRSIRELTSSALDGVNV